MKRSLEEEMAAALDGQFFWERTTKYEDFTTGPTAEIRRAQRAYSKAKKIPKPYVPTQRKEDLVKARIEAQKKLPNDIIRLRAAIMDLYGLTEAEFEGAAPKSRTALPRSHYVWAALRYNPNASLVEVGEIMGRHHSTIIYNRDQFESKKDMYSENVKKIDDMFGFKE